jgi:hypothetical protein
MASDFRNIRGQHYKMTSSNIHLMTVDEEGTYHWLFKMDRRAIAARCTTLMR